MATHFCDNHFLLYKYTSATTVEPSGVAFTTINGSFLLLFYKILLGNILIDFIFFIVYMQNFIISPKIGRPKQNWHWLWDIQLSIIHFSIFYSGFIYTIIIINVFSLQAKSTTVSSTKQASLQVISLALVRAKSQGTIPKLHNTANIEKVEIVNVHLFIVSFTQVVPTSLESNSCSIPSKLSFVAHKAHIEFDVSLNGVEPPFKLLYILQLWVACWGSLAWRCKTYLEPIHYEDQCSKLTLTEHF